MAIPIMAIMGGVMGGMGLAQMFPPMSRAMTYPQNRLWRNEMISVGDALQAWLRKEITDDELDFELSNTGLNPERVDWLKKVIERLVDVGDLMRLYRRGKIPPDALKERANKLGYTDKSVDDLLNSTEMIPSASDIIAFAVREVYTPEIAEAFGQYEGLDEVWSQAKEDIQAVGMSKDTFGKYWASHWILPSVTQGFEMLHRNVINDDDLDRLMVALDIMPFWRANLKKISYAPYTRVDVRRMHKLGIISDAELTRAYMDIGYNKEKAEGMTAFTIAYNKSPETSEQTEKDKEIAKERDLTKTDILFGYENGLLDEGETKTFLSSLGYDEYEVAYHMSKVAFKKEKDETDVLLKYYHDAYVRGVMAKNDIIDKFGELNLTSERVNRLFTMWDLEKTARVTKPTKAELLTFLRKGIIDKAVCTDELLGLGYSQRYVNWYLATA